MAALAAAQVPTIGVIDFYGLNRIPAEKLLTQTALKTGDPMPRSKADLEEKLESLQGVVRAEVTAHCCEAGKVILYIGVEEKGARHFDYHDPPTGPETLPDYVIENYREFLRAVNEAAARGVTAEDLSRGHSLMADRNSRSHQDLFVIHAELFGDKLPQVLRNAANEEHRAVAAHLLGYAGTKRLVVNDLQYALRDPDETVRGTALRALSAIAVLAQRDAELELRIAPTWFVEMLHSLAWNDRHRAAQALVRLTENRDGPTLELLRERASAQIVELARWRHLPHALAPFFLAGRMAGMSEKEIEEAWLRGDREAVIARLTASLSTSDKR